MIFCATVDDVCYEGYSSEAHLASLLRFFEEEDVRATFFVVPRAGGRPLASHPGYVELLKQAVAEGHAVGQHGLEHDRFETGIPPQMVLDLPHEGPARERLARERDVIEANLQVDLIRERLATGRRILEDALGFEVAGFRAPCLSICDNLFHALETEGYVYDSSRYLQMKSKPREITRADFDGSQYPGNLHEFPLTADYTWYTKREKFDFMMNLARHDLTACQRAGIPFVPMAHVSPVHECEDGCGFELYRRLLEFARERATAGGEELQALNLQETSTRFPAHV